MKGERNRLGAVGGERCAWMGCVDLIRDRRLCRDGKHCAAIDVYAQALRG
jgi:hypothetical protein